MERVLVTGATGYIGLHCVDQLLKQGYAVNGSVRSPERKDEIFEALKKNHTPTDNLNICITGAGGSIGSELCLQILNLNPKNLILIDNSENNLHQLEKKIGTYYFF